jgi:hypothetical protein
VHRQDQATSGLAVQVSPVELGHAVPRRDALGGKQDYEDVRGVDLPEYRLLPFFAPRHVTVVEELDAVPCQVGGCREELAKEFRFFPGITDEYPHGRGHGAIVALDRLRLAADPRPASRGSCINQARAPSVRRVSVW